MKRCTWLGQSLLLFAFFAVSRTSRAQALPAGSIGNITPGGLSVFGAVSKTYTGFEGQNSAVTAGFDMRLRSFFGLTPGLDLRGTYPIKKGNVAAEKDFLVGPTVSRSLGPVYVYGNYLVGRGAIVYPNAFVYGGNAYLHSTSTVYSPGGGIEYRLGPSWSVKADAQWQRWNLPVTDSGKTNSTSVSLGLAYRFGFPHFGKKEKIDTNDGTWQGVHTRFPGSK